MRVQNCVMLKDATEFNQLIQENKIDRNPYALVHNPEKTRWIISAWTPCFRPWGNGRCPCLHSDPKFPDAAPGETKVLRGWLSFYEGTDIDAELERITATGWQTDDSIGSWCSCNIVNTFKSGNIRMANSALSPLKSSGH